MARLRNRAGFGIGGDAAAGGTRETISSIFRKVSL